MERCEFCGQDLMYCTECDTEFCQNCDGGKNGMCASCLKEHEESLLDVDADDIDDFEEEFVDSDEDDEYSYSEEFDGDIEELSIKNEGVTIH